MWIDTLWYRWLPVHLATDNQPLKLWDDSARHDGMIRLFTVALFLHLPLLFYNFSDVKQTKRPCLTAGALAILVDQEGGGVIKAMRHYSRTSLLQPFSPAFLSSFFRSSITFLILVL